MVDKVVPLPFISRNAEPGAQCPGRFARCLAWLLDRKAQYPQQCQDISVVDDDRTASSAAVAAAVAVLPLSQSGGTVIMTSPLSD